MKSVWEFLGEKVGYAMAAVVLGPPAAVARRERRILRAALAQWSDEIGAIRLESRGTMKRAGKLLSAAGSYPFEVRLDPFRKRASLDVATGTLPPQARGRLAKNPTRVSAPTFRYRMTASLWRSLKPLAEVDGITIGSKTLDAETARSLARDAADGGLAKLDTFILEMENERMVLDIVAPTDASQWKTIAAALASFVDACVRRWGSSYR
jgi:hypothetical protein